MTTNIQHSTLGNMPDHSRVWIYQSDRPFTDKEAQAIKHALQIFTKNWAAHGKALTAAGDVLYNCFVILMVDEQLAGASGCSIDSSVHFIKTIEQTYHVNLFNRLNITYKINEKINIVSPKEFKNLIQTGEIGPQTTVFNNLVQDKSSFMTNWEIMVQDSWCKKFLTPAV